MRDARPLGEVARQHAPWDSPFRHRKDGLEHRSHTQGARSSTAFGGGEHLFAPLPFLVSQVAWRDFFVHLPLVPTCEDFSDRLLEQTMQEAPACRARGRAHSLLLSAVGTTIKAIAKTY